MIRGIDVNHGPMEYVWGASVRDLLAAAGEQLLLVELVELALPRVVR